MLWCGYREEPVKRAVGVELGELNIGGAEGEKSSVVIGGGSRAAGKLKKVSVFCGGRSTDGKSAAGLRKAGVSRRVGAAGL